MVIDQAHARTAAEARLSALPDRWEHSRMVATRAATIDVRDGAHLDDAHVVAAWLHDVGYAPDLAVTGFHPLDGAQFLERERADQRIIALVAHHSCARYEAAERGLIEELNKYPREEGLVADALTWADMTTSPTGEPVTFAERLAEVLERYPPHDPVHRAMVKATDELAATVQRVEQHIAFSSRNPQR